MTESIILSSSLIIILKISSNLKFHNFNRFRTLFFTVFARYDNRIVGGDIFHIIDFNMDMFLSRSATHTTSIFTPKGVTNQDTSVNSIYAKIENENGLLVLHPDMLISPTRIADAIGCVRRGVISERGKSLGGFSKPAVLGNLRHSFIEVIMLLYRLTSVILISYTKYQQPSVQPLTYVTPVLFIFIYTVCC